MKYIIILLILLSSCMTVQKAQNYLEDRGQLPRICADKYPPTVTPGQTIIKRDTLTIPGVTIPCPPAEIDTVTGETKTVYVKCPPSREIRDTLIRHDTIENFARVVALGLQIDSIKIELGVSRQNEKQAVKQARNRLFLLLGFGVSIVAGIALKFKNII